MSKNYYLMVKFKVCLLLSILSLKLYGQSAESKRDVVNQSLQWFSMSSSIKMTQRLSLYAEGQFRYVSAEPQQFQARTSLDIFLNKHFSISPLGYVYTWNDKYGKQPASFVNHEHRLFEQVVFKHKYRRINLSHRLRLEQRFIQSHSIDAEGQKAYHGYNINQDRLRYRIYVTIPINKEKIEPQAYFLSIYDEAFMSWGENITYNDPDQNRLFAGLGYQFNKDFSIQAGCLYQLLIKSNGTKQENNVGLQLQANYNFDLTKKAE